ncbi:major facilitator superfamily domain-containing protein [Clohesyomyces aquaticus]|uniref:Major facilitator superfamily domain-containing protein n=1 Tax=Clohesyomyces aquaticus TaxID=1231657 RepID=A0A1Y2A0D4_9PLEO|nr:major facilitator superfamily domain-containing protein [Clohesyomyces aquaticus]
MLYKVLDTKGTTYKLVNRTVLRTVERAGFLKWILWLSEFALVGSILCAAAPSATTSITGRAVAGCGAAGLMQGSFAIVTKTVPLVKCPYHLGLFLNLGGSMSIIVSVCCFLLAIKWRGQSLPWSSTKIAGLFIVPGVLLVGFLAIEWKMGDDAAVPLSVLRQCSIASGAVYLFLFSMPNFSYGIYVPMFFKAVKGFSAHRSGAEIRSLALTQILVITVVGALVSKFGYYTPFIIGIASSVVGSGFITLLDIDTPHPAWVAHFLIRGGGTGAALDLPYTAASAVLKEEDIVTGNVSTVVEAGAYNLPSLKILRWNCARLDWHINTRFVMFFIFCW